MRFPMLLVGLMALGATSGDVRTSAKVSIQVSPDRTAIQDPARLAVHYRTALRVEEWGCHHEQDSIVTEGLITNVTEERLGGILAVVAYYTEDGTLVRSDNMLIAHRPILPAQTLPFKVIAEDNPAIRRCSLDFKTDAGALVGWLLSDRVIANDQSSVSADDIRQAQQLLRNLGLYTGDVDGQMGRSTRAAVMAFQRLNGFLPTGELKPGLLVLLEQSEPQWNPRASLSQTAESRPATDLGTER